MIYILRFSKGPAFYSLFSLLIFVYLFVVYLIFINRPFNMTLFIIMLSSLYPISLVWEQANVRFFEIKIKTEGLKGITFHEDVRAVEGILSLSTLLFIALVDAIILLARLFYPNSIKLDSIVFAACSLGISIIFYIKRPKPAE